MNSWSVINISHTPWW